MELSTPVYSIPTGMFINCSPEYAEAQSDIIPMLSKMTHDELCNWYVTSNADFIILSELLAKLIQAEGLMQHELAEVEYYQTKVSNWIELDMIEEINMTVRGERI